MGLTYCLKMLMAPAGRRELFYVGDQMLELLIVGFGGFIGATGRYMIGGLLAERTGPGFPYETLVINVTGCFAIGLFMTMATETFNWHPHARLFVAIGILGGYTTFSTLGYETLKLVEDGNVLLGFANGIGSLTLGLIAVWLGTVLGRLFA